MTAPAPPRLLYVDDDELNRDMLVRRLRRHGFEVAAVEGGPQALDWLAGHPCDLVLLDVQMPVMSGTEVLRRIRATYSPAQLPVMMVTARSASEDVVEALDLGANDFIAKPVDLPVALARIRTQLARREAERALQSSEERYALAVRGANDGLWDWTLDDDRIYFSPRWKEIGGYAPDELPDVPATWFDRVHPDDLARLRGDLADHLAGRTSHFEVEHRLRHRRGDFRWVLSRAVAVRDATGRAVRLAGSLTDITEGKVADALTGLPNRSLFLDRLGRLFELARRRHDLSFAVLYLDLDGFKTVNDSLGHDVGDQLLVLVAHRLETSLRATDTVSRLPDEPLPADATNHTVARLGGDEFAVILAGLRSVEDATTVAARIGEAFAQPFALDGYGVFVNVSIGIARYDPSYERAEDVVRDADTALHQAKASGKGRYELFDVSMRRTVLERLQLQNDMRRALDAGEFRLHYQPILAIESGRVTAFEALLRWQHPTRGLLTPAVFIGAAEESGLILALGKWALAEACRQFRAWLDACPAASLTIAVNVSARQLVQPDFATLVANVLETTGLAPRYLELEVTESSLISDPDAARRTLDALHGMGVRLSIDDFGTGYSSLGCLRSFPFDRLKIDRSFVVDLHANADAAGMVRTIVDLGRQMGLEIIAEGIETIGQLDQVRALECDYAQGYYFARPLTAASATDLVHESQEPSAAPVPVSAGAA